MSIKYNTRVYEMKSRGTDVIVLSLGEANFDIPLLPFSDLPFPAIYHYSHSRGLPQLRARLAEYFDDQYGVSFDVDRQIIISAGSKIVIHMSLMAMLNPGDEVIIPEPAWVSYPEQVKLCRGVPVMLPWQTSMAEVDRYITPRTRCIIINNPHNPTGKVYSAAELQSVLDVARAHDLYVVSDEAYSDFILDDDRFVSLGKLDPRLENTVVCNSISKNYGISGWRLGYAISSPAFTDQLLKLQQHMITCAPTILEHYIANHFFEIIEITKPQIHDVVRKRRRMGDYMKRIGLCCMPGSATFYLMVSIEPSRLGSEAFCDRLLEERNVSVVPGLGYGTSCDHFVRVSVGTESWDRVQHGLDQIKRLVDETTA